MVVKPQRAVEHPGEVFVDKGDAERTHGVPDPQIGDGDPWHLGMPRRRPPRRLLLAGHHMGREFQPEGMAFGVVRMGPGGGVAVAVERLADPVRLAMLRQPRGPQQPGQRARGEGAAREAEDIDLIPRLVILRQEAVTGEDILRHPDAKGTADQPVPARRQPGLAMAGAHPGNVFQDLHPPRRIAAPRGAVQQAYVGILLLPRAVPRPVTIDRDAFHPSASRCRHWG